MRPEDVQVPRTLSHDEGTWPRTRQRAALDQPESSRGRGDEEDNDDDGGGYDDPMMNRMTKTS